MIFRDSFLPDPWNMKDIKSIDPSEKPVVMITASAAASVTATAKAIMDMSLKDNMQINNAVNKVLKGYKWKIVEVPAK